MDRVMDYIPVFSPAGVQARAWRAYHCRRKLMLVPIISDEDFTNLYTVYSVAWRQQCRHG
jgi:hypothetical protein